MPFSHYQAELVMRLGLRIFVSMTWNTLGFQTSSGKAQVVISSKT